MLGTVSKSRQPGTASGTPDGLRQDESESSISRPRSADRPSESRIDRIARRAHQIYEARGGQHGKAIEDWLQAEREVDSA
jgi:hypothetical protein